MLRLFWCRGLGASVCAAAEYKPRWETGQSAATEVPGTNRPTLRPKQNTGQGAEIIRLYQTLLGKEGFRKGMDLYFKRHDGQVGGSFAAAEGWAVVF